MKIKPLKQKHDSGCGPTTIKMVANYFGINVSQKAVEKLCGAWRRNGMSNDELIAVLKKMGLRVKASYNAHWQDLITLNTKERVIIVTWMLRGYIGHFSIVDSVNSKYIWLAESESGRIVKFEKIIFLRLWFDYNDLMYPERSSNFNVRWIAVVTKNKTLQRKS